MTLLSTHNSLCVFVCVQGFESENSAKGNKEAQNGLLLGFCTTLLISRKSCV